MNNKSKISVSGARVHCSIRLFYSENLVKCSSSKLFLIVSSYIYFFGITPFGVLQLKLWPKHHNWPDCNFSRIYGQNQLCSFLYTDCRSVFGHVMIKIWVFFHHKSCRAMSQLSTSKNSGQLNLSTLSYDQMSKYYSFSHFA